MYHNLMLFWLFLISLGSTTRTLPLPVIGPIDKNSSTQSLLTLQASDASVKHLVAPQHEPSTSSWGNLPFHQEYQHCVFQWLSSLASCVQWWSVMAANSKLAKRKIFDKSEFNSDQDVETVSWFPDIFDQSSKSCSLVLLDCCVIVLLQLRYKMWVLISSKNKSVSKQLCLVC